MTIGRVPYEWMALRAAYQAQTPRWACRGIVNRDGSVRLVPLYLADVPRWAAEVFEGYPIFDGFSVEPDE